jgi:REP element-mobilizing transposase RayT
MVERSWLMIIKYHIDVLYLYPHYSPMPRPLRIEYEDAYYHVMNRGRGRKTIFDGDAYYNAFLETLKEAHQRFKLQILCYCLMGNHYHLLAKTPEANLGASYAGY